MNINEKIDKYKSILNKFEDNNQRYDFLLVLAKKANPFPEEFRLEEFSFWMHESGMVGPKIRRGINELPL